MTTEAVGEEAISEEAVGEEAVGEEAVGEEAVGWEAVAAEVVATEAVATEGGHLHAVDVVRFLTLLGVIVVHSTSLTYPHGTNVTGGVLVVLHVTREVFLFLSAFVLAYSYRSRLSTARSFWRRRYPLVVVPYVVWSAVYLLTDGRVASPLHLSTTYLGDLADGGAHFHLYFLLLTFQLYLVFPALLAFLARRPRLHAPLLASSVLFELAFSGAVHYGWRPPVLRYWLDHPGSWLPSYELYVVAGVLAALHLDAVTVWVRRHQMGIALGFVASIGLGVTSYVLDLTVLGYAPLHASEVFQPVVVVEAVGAVLGQYALGLWVSDRLDARRLRQLERSSDISFGVYLAHPLLIAGVLDVAGAAGVSATVGRLPSGLVEVLVVIGLVPFIYLVTAGAVVLLRRTPLSLALSGRRRLAAPLRRSTPSRPEPTVVLRPSTPSRPAPTVPPLLDAPAFALSDIPALKGLS